MLGLLSLRPCTQKHDKSFQSREKSCIDNTHSQDKKPQWVAGEESKVSSSWVPAQGHPEPELGLAQLGVSLHLSEFLNLSTFLSSIQN